MRLFSKTFWLFIAKLLLLAIVGSMVAVQIPELIYDLGPSRPRLVEGPADLLSGRFGGTVFGSVAGEPDFSRAFRYRRYGLEYTYFTLKPYGQRLVVRTHRKVTADWKRLRRFLGKLRPFWRQPFSYRIRQIYRDRFKVQIPAQAWFLALDDVPRLSGWSVAATIFGSLLWLGLFYGFFLHRRFFPKAR